MGLGSQHGFLLLPSTLAICSPQDPQSVSGLWSTPFMGSPSHWGKTYCSYHIPSALMIWLFLISLTSFPITLTPALSTPFFSSLGLLLHLEYFCHLILRILPTCLTVSLTSFIQALGSNFWIYVLYCTPSINSTWHLVGTSQMFVDQEMKVNENM